MEVYKILKYLRFVERYECKRYKDLEDIADATGLNKIEVKNQLEKLIKNTVIETTLHLYDQYDNTIGYAIKRRSKEHE